MIDAPSLPDRHGHFGQFGGMFVPETLMTALLELTEEYTKAKVGSSRVDLQACKLEYSIVSPK